MAEIKVIAWDLGNVLCWFEERSKVLTRIVRHFSELPETEEVFGGKTGEDTYSELDTGALSVLQLWETLCERYKISKDRLPFERFTALMWRHLEPIPASVELARHLQERYRFIAVSNGDVGSRYIAEVLAIYCGLKFERIFVSAEVGVKKPGMLTIVAEYLASTGVMPEEVVFVDDIAVYRDAGREVGFRVVSYDASKEPIPVLIDRLEAIGVKVGVRAYLLFNPCFGIFKK